MNAIEPVENERSNATEDAFRLVVDTTPALIHTGRPDGCLDYFNQRWLDFLGCSLEEVCGWRWTDSIHPEDVARMVQKWHAALTSGEPFEAEARVRRADGEYRLLLHRKLPLRDEHGVIVKWFGSSVDIEDRKRVEEAMLQKEKDLQELIDAVPQHIGVVSSDGRPLFVNKAALEYHGLTREEWFDAAAPDSKRNKIVHPDDLERVLSAHTEGISSGKPYGFEVRMRRKDGEYRRFLFRSNPLRDNRGHVVRWYSTRTDIEDLKRAEDSLRLSEAYMAQAQQITHVGSWAYKPPDICEYWSAEMFRMFGFDPSKGYPSNDEVSSLIHPEDRQQADEALTQHFKHGRVYDLKYRIIRADGQLRVIQDFGTPVFENGVVTRFVGACLDITEQEQTMQELKRSEFYLKEGQRLSHSGSWSFTPSGECDYWSPELYKILGFDPAKGIPGIADYLKLVHADDRTIVEATINNMIAGVVGCDIKKRVVRNDGEVRVIRCVGVPVFEEGKVLRFIGTLMDITEQERKTEELRRSEEQWRDVFENNPTMYFMVDARGIVLSVNPFGAEQLGYSVTELVGQPVVNVFCEADRKAAERNLATCLEQLGQEKSWELHKIRKDGTMICVRETAKGVSRSSGPIVLIACEDITQQHRMTEELQRREAYLAQAQAISHTGSFGWNLSSGQLYWSDETFDILGYQRAIKPTLELVFERVHPEDLAPVRETLSRASQNGKSFDFEHRLLLPNGLIKHVHVIARPFKDEHGNVELVGSVMDVTARQKAFQEIRALKDELYKENIVLREEVGKTSMFEEVIGTCPVLQTVLARAAKVAPTDSTVLILGETGTGKELIARAIHKRSKRSERAFVSVNCAAIPSTLIMSELFGHEKGAFTGAIQRRLGRFELAEGGTLFLDEVGDLPSETQIALLRVLQEHEFERVGGTEVLHADARVIAATNRDLPPAITAGLFRSDLYYRLSVFPIKLPSLRERREDIPLLVNYFVDRFAKRAGKKIKNIRKKAIEALQEYSWPGNVRELQNVIERSLIVCETDEFSIDKSWLSTEPMPRVTEAPAAEQMLSEREHIEKALTQTKGKVSGVSGAAAKLGMPASTLESKIRSLKINKFRFKEV